MNQETLFRGARERISGLVKKAPLPFWMSGEKLPQNEVEKLSELSQLEYGITHDLSLQGIDPNSPKGKKKTTEQLRQILEDYHWLS